MAHRIAPRAERDLDHIWYQIARECGSVDIANRLIDTITDRFSLLAGFPYIGRVREEDFRLGSRSFAVGEYVIVYCLEGEDVLILRVAHGRRDIAAMFRD
jgi:toxin ParE1/3/4